ncbi:protease [Radiobacillus kanasensis]|uniref:protease n=1 Tax=Radiobacillus kanasensis TaxID=2844358 RepID=UPI001E3FC74F|nr:protease [Radiobacillus kanasensis]UFT99720.1 protease [Radiobacillus kanasensis]
MEVIFIDALQIYWWLLWGSLAIAIIFLFLGNLLDGLLDGLGELFNPLLLFGTLSVIAGSGVLLTKYTEASTLLVLIISAFIGICAYFLLYYFLIIPMSQAESSNAISVYDLQGKMGEVITSIPAQGMGEVFIQLPNGSRSETAKSFDETDIPQGTNIVVIEVKDQIMYVSELKDFN